jgi:hypothetical protein
VKGMSLKSIEMQVAIPRTGDAGMLQSQLLNKPIQDQAMLAAASMKQLEEQRKKSNKVDESSDHLKANQEGHQKNQYHSKNKSATQSKDEIEQTEHPYKGHHIDLSL